MGAFEWAPADDFIEAFGDSVLVPPEVRRILSLDEAAGRAGRPGAPSRTLRRRCRGRSTEWTRHAQSGVPYRLTVVAADKAGDAVTERVLSAASEALVKILSAVDGESVVGGATPPARPASIDVVLLLWDGKKYVPRRGETVTPEHVNTGVSVRYSGGRVVVLVFRKEEAIKTLFHEILHAYGVGDWCNGDPDVIRGSQAIARACCAAVPPSLLRPTEAIVDLVAVDMCGRVFGGPGPDSVFKRARIAARRLAAHLATVGRHMPLQATAAIEYYIVKFHLLCMSEDVRRAHAKGLQRPDKQALRNVFLSAPQSAAFARRHLPKAPAGMSLRMTPFE